MKYKSVLRINGKYVGEPEKILIGARNEGFRKIHQDFHFELKSGVTYNIDIELTRSMFETVKEMWRVLKTK